MPVDGVTVSVPVPIKLAAGQLSPASWMALQSDALPLSAGVKPFCSVRVMPVGSVLSVGTLSIVSVSLDALLGALGLSDPLAGSAVADAADALTANASTVSEVRSEAVLGIAGVIDPPRDELDTIARAGDGMTVEPARFAAMPRTWLYTQAAIVLFVLIGIVIAITKLA